MVKELPRDRAGMKDVKNGRVLPLKVMHIKGFAIKGIMNEKELTLKALDLRKVVVDMIMKSGGGHIGGDFSVMETLVTLYFDQMNISPENKDDLNRDYFIMSKGHSVESYYAVLADKGFFDTKELVDTFSQFGSKFIGHPNNEIDGIEMNSGSLGHGLPVSVGIAPAIEDF